MFGDAFAGVAAAVSAACGGPYHAARVVTVSAPVMVGGSIVTPGVATERACMCQVDVATEAMRQAEGFTQGDVRLLIVSLAGGLDTDAMVEVDAGPGAGTYSVQAVSRDAMGAYWEARGRRA